MGISDQRQLALWAKATVGPPTSYHPLTYHMLDVGSVAQELFRTVLSNRTKKWLAESMSISILDCEKWITFIAACHDIGKAHPQFQAMVPDLKISIAKQGIHFSQLSLGHEKVPHGTVTSKIMLNELKTVLNEGKVDPGFLQLISFAAGSHHGTIPSSIDVMSVSPSVLGGVEWAALRKEMIKCVIETIGLDISIWPRLSVNNANSFFVFIAGLISVSDWIGSDIENFPYERVASSFREYWCATSSKAEGAVRKLMWGIGDQTGQPETFGEVFGFQDLFPLQSSTVNMVTKLEGPSLVLIEGPMGQGKTEAAMFLENYWRRTLDNRGAYVALPTQATANQMFHRIRLYLEHASFDGYVNLHLLHGYAALSPEYAQLRTQNSVSDDSQTVVAVQWFSSQKKRAILSSYGVGTVDQALMAVLPSKHFFVRLFGLAGKTVVVDEVHAYDLYTSTLLEILLSWLSALGCSVVVLSATLPRKRSAELIYAYSGGEPLPSVGAYPRISWASKSGVGSQTIESTGRKVEVLLDWIEDNHDALTALFTDLLRDGGHAALICSTISRAQDMYQAIEGPLRKAGIEVDLFHARFPLEDRLAKENTCISSFGKKERDPSKKHLLIATQVIEQSLDLDFDLIVSDIAPVDLLLQRIGRLHRHPGHRRPLLLTCPRLYIVEPQLKEGNPTFGDSSFVYWESTLLSTYAHLLGRDKITTPTDIEELVEAVYPPTLPNGSPLPWVERLEELNRERETALSSEEYMARSAVIPSPREGKVWRDIPRYLEEEDDEMHVSLQARTRLIRPGVSLVCLYAIGSQTYLDELGTVPITQKELGSQEMQRNLLNRTVRIDKPSIVFGFRKRPKSDLEIALDRTPLRGHRIVAFPLSEGGNVFRSEIEGHPIRLSKELGIVLANEERTE